jgi:hypothetical protein
LELISLIAAFIILLAVLLKRFCWLLVPAELQPATTTKQQMQPIKPNTNAASSGPSHNSSLQNTTYYCCFIKVGFMTNLHMMSRLNL